MFDFIRTHQRLMQFVLLLLILPSFVLIGVSGYTTYTAADDELVSLADGAVTLQEFNQARLAQLTQYQRQWGENFDPALLDTEAARKALLDSLVDRRVVANVAQKQRFNVSDNALRQAIAAVPDFQEEGHFSPERYYAALNLSGLNSAAFEASQRNALALDRVLRPVATTASLPEAIVTGLRKALATERSVRLHAFPAAQYRDHIAVTQDALENWYAEHSADYALPEYVNIQYLVLDEAAAMANLPTVSEDALQSWYTQNKHLYDQAGRVNLSHILFNIPAGASAEERAQIQAQAQAVAARVAAAPATFADTAREVSQDAGTAREGGALGWISRGTLPPTLEDVAFSLAEGGVSGVLESSDGLHIFYANAIQPEKNPSFSEVREQVAEAVTRQRGAERFADLASQLTTLVYDNPDSLEPVASTLGLALRTASGIARDRLLSSQDVGEHAALASKDAELLYDARLRRAVFTPDSLDRRQNSGVITLAPDTLLVARVTAVQAATVPPLAQVQERVRTRVLDERALAAARAAGEQALETWKTAPATVPAGFGEPQAVSRLQRQDIAQTLFDAIFQIAVQDLPAYVGVTENDRYVVARIESASPGSEEALALLAGLSGELASTWGNLEQQAVLQQLRTQENVQWLPQAERVLQGETEL